MTKNEDEEYEANDLGSSGWEEWVMPVAMAGGLAAFVIWMATGKPSKQKQQVQGVQYKSMRVSGADAPPQFAPRPSPAQRPAPSGTGRTYSPPTSYRLNGAMPILPSVIPPRIPTPGGGGSGPGGPGIGPGSRFGPGPSIGPLRLTPPPIEAKPYDPGAAAPGGAAPGGAAPGGAAAPGGGDGGGGAPAKEEAPEEEAPEEAPEYEEAPEEGPEGRSLLSDNPQPSDEAVLMGQDGPPPGISLFRNLKGTEMQNER